MHATTATEVPAVLQELERRMQSAKDIIVPAAQFKLEREFGMNPTVALPLGFGDALVRLPMTANANAQTASKLNIPKAYYDRMFDLQPDLLCENVNTWAAQAEDKNWLLRILDDKVRANLSDRFRILDNYSLAWAALQQAKASGAMIQSLRLSDDRFEMRLLHPDMEEVLKDGAAGIRACFVPGCYIGNSETGRGGLEVSMFLLDRICSNGYRHETNLRKVHLGGQNEAGLLSRETVAAKDATVWLEVRDTIAAVFDKERFAKVIGAMRDSALQELVAPIEAVDTVVAAYGMDEADKQAILNELISPSHDRDPGRTVFGLISAITERAKAYADTDLEKATAFETAGMQLATKARELVPVRVR